MKNLVFRLLLTVTVCWQSGNTERSANGYFYDKPEGTLFDESPGLGQVTNTAPLFPPVEVSSSAQSFTPPPPVLPTGGYFPQLLGPLPSAPETVNRAAAYEIVPAKLIYQDTQAVEPTVNVRLQQQSVANVQNYDFLQPQQIYRVPAGGNLEPLAFSAHDSNQAFNTGQQPCGPEPIVAQYNPQLVDLSQGGPLTRLITTCGPNNDCSTITLQSDLNRQLGVLAPQQKTSYEADFQQSLLAQPRSANAGVFAEQTPLVRPPGRRLIQYSEIQRDDPYN